MGTHSGAGIVCSGIGVLALVVCLEDIGLLSTEEARLPNAFVH